MALGPNSSHDRNEMGRRMSRSTTLPYSAQTLRINAENSLNEFRRDRANVRPYVRSGTQKLKWTHELHQCFMLAVDQLGGKEKATPKKILQLMDEDGITIAHVKSHLQMYRSGKINADGMSKSDYKVWQGGKWQTNNAGQQAAPVNGHDLAQSSSNLEYEPAMALIQLKEEGRSSDSGAAATEFQTGAPDSVGRRTQDGPSPCFQPFLSETSMDTPVDVTASLSARKRKAEEGVELNLTMATRSRRPSFQFPCPSTPEEASLSLALS